MRAVKRITDERKIQTISHIVVTNKPSKWGHFFVFSRFLSLSHAHTLTYSLTGTTFHLPVFVFDESFFLFLQFSWSGYDFLFVNKTCMVYKSVGGIYMVEEVNRWQRWMSALDVKGTHTLSIAHRINKILQ